MENKKLIRLLASIGKTCFIDHYWDFKNCIDKQKLAQKIYQYNNNRKPDKNLTRIYCAIQIFNNHLEKEALELVLKSKNHKVTAETKHQAQEILTKENNRS